MRTGPWPRYPLSADAVALLQGLLGEDRIDGLQGRAALLDDDVGDVLDEALHGPGGADAVQGVHGEVGVPDPAIAVVPIAARSRIFRNRGRQRGDDSAGLVEAAELQRDR